jgi:hypothetical protein
VTAPTPESSLPLGIDPSVERMKRIVRQSDGALNKRPGLAQTLMDANASDSDIRRVTGFIRAMDVATQTRVARQAGAKVKLSAQDRAYASSIGEHTQDVEKDDETSWWDTAWNNVTKAISSTGNFLFDNPVAHTVFTVLDAPLNALRTGYRMASSAFDTSNDDEVARAKREGGYDNSLWDNIQFYWGQGESLYHDTSDLEDKYGKDWMDLARKIQRDPKDFFDNQFDKMAPEDQAKAADLWENNKQFKEMYDQLGERHISVGRDLANSVGLDGTAFNVVSGSIDAAVAWFADPLLVVGNISRVGRVGIGTGKLSVAVPFAKINKYGLDDIQDASQVRKLLATDPETGKAVNQIGEHWQRFLDDGTAFRNAKAADDHVEMGAIFARMQARQPQLMPLFDEIVLGKRIDFSPAGLAIQPHDEVFTTAHGTRWRVADVKPVENLGQLADRLSNTAAFTRLTNGIAADRRIVMPGLVSARAERKAQRVYNRRKDASEKFGADLEYSYTSTDDMGRMIPLEEDGTLQAYAQQAGEKIKDSYGKSTAHAILDWRAARARFERAHRRLSKQMSTRKTVDFTQADSVQDVRNIARMWLPKHEADRIAAVYAGGTLAERRQVYKGMLLQSAHAAGTTASDEGSKLLRKIMPDDAELEHEYSQKYGHGNTDLLQTTAGKRRVGLHPNQMATTAAMPSFKEWAYIAAKGAFAGKYRSFIQSDGLDTAMGAVKIGWITSRAGGYRNALDEVAGVALKGGGADMLRARAAFKTVEGERKAAARAAKVESLEGAVAHRIPMALLGKARSVRDVATATVFGRLLGMMSHHGSQDYEQMVESARILADQELSEMARRVILQTHYTDDTGILMGEEAAGQMARQGVLSRKVEMKGYGNVDIEADGGQGLDAWSNKMRIMFGKGMPANVALSALKHGLSDEEGVARVFARLNDSSPEMRAFRRDNEFANTNPHTGGAILNPNEQEAALRDLAGRIYEDTRMTVVGRAGRVPGPASPFGTVDEFAGSREAVPYGDFHHRTPDVYGKTLDLRVKSGQPTPIPESLDKALRQEQVFHPFQHNLRGSSQAHKSKALKQWMRENGYGKVHVDTNEGDLPVVLDEMVAHEGNDPLAAFTRAHGPQHAIHPELADLLLKGQVPDRNWLKANVDEAFRPESSVGRLWAPVNPKHKSGQMLEGYTEFLSKAYEWAVNKPIASLSRNPLLTSNFHKARMNAQGYKEFLISKNFRPEDAEQMANDMALRHAEQMTVKDIDNPEVASQFSILARNMWAFVRAQEDWLRRWGRNFHDRPEALRKAQLLLEGSQDAGIVEKDTDGNLVFTYPGSGALVEALTTVGAKLHVPGVVAIPHVDDWTSQLTMLNPSLDNPVGFSATPVVSMPWRVVQGFMPEMGVFNAGMDRMINGQLGAGRPWYESLLPSPVNRILEGQLKEDPASQFASSLRASFANLEAAGLTPKSDPMENPGEWAEYLSRVQTGTKNHLFLRTIFSFFAPAAPSLGEQGVDKEANWLYQKAGVHMLKDQFKYDVQNLGYQRAKELWTVNHPDELVYTVGSTNTGAEGAFAPATLGVARFMEDNRDFMQNYKGISTYFLPEAPGDYSQVAWNAQLEQGFRSYKDFNQYVNDVVIQRGEKDYFQVEDIYKPRIDQARARGFGAQAKALESERDEVKRGILSMNPLLKAKFSSWGADSVRKSSAIAELERLVQDPHKPDIPALRGAGEMLQTYYAWQDARLPLKGERSKQATGQRTVVDSKYESAMADIIKRYPGLLDFYNGVFKNPQLPAEE